MNNKGFAITTILYGTLILFLMLMLSLLGILSTYTDRLSKLIDNNNGARDIIKGVVNDEVEYELSIPGTIVTTIGEVVSVAVKLNSSNWSTVGIKTCNLTMTLSDNLVLYSDVTGMNGWSVSAFNDNYTFSTSNPVTADTYIFTVLVLANGSGTINFTNIECSSDGSFYYSLPSVSKGIEVLS